MQDHTAANKNIAKNSIFLTIRMVIVLGITLYTTRILLEVLGVVDYGVYNVVCGFVTMFSFLNTSMSNGIQRFFNYEYGKNGENGANKVFCTAVYIQIILSFIIVLIVEIIGLWYLHNKMVLPPDRIVASEWVFQFAMLTFILNIMQAPFSAAVTAHEKFDFYAVISVLDAVLKLCIVFLLKISPTDKLIVYGFLIALISVINLVIYYIYCKRNFGEVRFRRGLDIELFKRMLGFSGWNLFGSLSGVMKEQGINLVINFFFGPVVNAARGVAAQVNSGIQGFVGNILTPVRPQVVQSYARGDVNRALGLTYSISKFSSCFFLMMAIPASLEIDYVLKIWLGNNVPAHTNFFTILVLATTLINILNGATSTVVHATGIMKDYQLWGSLVGISSVPIAFIILKFDAIPEMALLTVLFCTALGHIIGLFIVKRLVGMPIREYYNRVILPIFIVFIFSTILVSPIRIFMGEGVLRFVLVVIFSIVVVFFSLYYIGLQKNERTLFLQLLKSIISKIHTHR